MSIVKVEPSYFIGLLYGYGCIAVSTVAREEYMLSHDENCI